VLNTHLRIVAIVPEREAVTKHALEALAAPWGATAARPSISWNTCIEDKIHKRHRPKKIHFAIVNVALWVLVPVSSWSPMLDIVDYIQQPYIRPPLQYHWCWEAHVWRSVHLCAEQQALIAHVG